MHVDFPMHHVALEATPFMSWHRGVVGLSLDLESEAFTGCGSNLIGDQKFSKTLKSRHAVTVTLSTSVSSIAS